MGVWIKFFLSWKRELDNPNYDIDLAMNNVDPDGMPVDKDGPCRDNSEGDRKEITTEENSNNEGEDETRVINDFHSDLQNKNSGLNNIDVIELKRLKLKQFML